MTQTIRVRHYEEEDLDKVCAWAEARGLTLFKAMLPKTGGIAYDEETGEELACGWLYMDNSVGVAFPHWLLANPKNGIKTSREAIRLLGEWMEYLAEDLDYGVFVTFFEEGAMTREAKTNGWNLVGGNQSVMIKFLRK